ncbi:translation initiation factor IF-2, putative [Plasmodium berghei]|uniref:Translation initiation factor IF-2, putative n=2 Tax=Plasmodium berghei TaxID=5821 RepID=A0A509AHK0_PLABA|nr:translation initiation factor IF-2, putative [Plasmodium berghei ANKA]CXI23152.1 translation initiation factor IF-2, putative [Plasmodium berghei]SCM20166.1 translation initiation factor IF-2, putative [Plasmodium berghei]SCN23800.1 translation initiation factor IF-2, putative [Plasmodium berghei]SCO59244.1 translation initiation factor IF-2, putative [Plasmodium berghei]SCO60177.1 translation initiation factor IF-2, putative [Plasmodium berghei]|eukprot:XP_034420782.1 translation initiation factor IF-2, putative [Plasmodium berghei ANKA]
MNKANIKKIEDPNLWIYEHIIKKGKKNINDNEFNKEVLKKAREQLKLILKDSKKYDTKLKELDNRKQTFNYMRANKKINPNSFIFNPYKEKYKNLDIKKFFKYQNNGPKYSNNNGNNNIELFYSKDMSNLRSNSEYKKKKYIINIMKKIKDDKINKISFFFNNPVNYYDTHLKEKYMNEVLKKIDEKNVEKNDEKKSDLEQDDAIYSIINNACYYKTEENNINKTDKDIVKDDNLNNVKDLSYNIYTETLDKSDMFNAKDFCEEYIIDNSYAKINDENVDNKKNSCYNLNDKNSNDAGKSCVEKKNNNFSEKKNNLCISENFNKILLYNNMNISSKCSVGGSDSLLSILEKLKENKKNKANSSNLSINEFEKTIYNNKQNEKEKNKSKHIEIKTKDSDNYYKKGAKENMNKIKDDEKKDNSRNQYEYIDSNNITIYNLSQHINIEESKIINVCKYILDNDYVNKYTKLEKEVAELICEELNVLNKLKYSCIDLKKRNPIVTILGHVDHGKTTLLDCFRNSNIAKNEVGGITQKLGAFEIIDKKKKKKITFLDTPGHNVFKTIRKRCVQCTDLIVLVISADDGIMTETVECLELAQKYNIPLIIAVNKIDKCNSENDKMLKIETLSKALLRYNIITENENGHVPIVPISAKKNINIDLLQNTIFNVSDKLNLICDHGNLCSAYLLEKKIDESKGKILTVICKSGILKVGAYILVGNAYTKIKKIYNSYDKVVNEAYPSEVAQIVCSISFTNNNNLKYGDMILEMKNLKIAQRVAKYKFKMAQYSLINEAYFEKSFEKNQEDKALTNFLLPQIPIIIKTCDEGSLNAILEGINEYNKKEKNEKYCNIFNFIERNYINKNILNDEKITDKNIFKNWEPFKIITKGIGTFNISDLKFCEYTNPCFIFSFNIDINSNIQKNIDNMNGIILRSHNIIYELFNDIENICNFYFDSLHLYEPVSKMIINKTGYYSIKNSKGNNNKKSKRVVLSVDIKDGVCNASHTYNIIRNKQIIHKNLTILSMQKNKQNTNELTKTCNANSIIFNTFSENFLVGDEIIAFKKTTRSPLFGKIKSFKLPS